jgi:hypothetical protein
MYAELLHGTFCRPSLTLCPGHQYLISSPSTVRHGSAYQPQLAGYGAIRIRAINDLQFSRKTRGPLSSCTSFCRRERHVAIVFKDPCGRSQRYVAPSSPGIDGEKALIHVEFTFDVLYSRVGRTWQDRALFSVGARCTRPAPPYAPLWPTPYRVECPSILFGISVSDMMLGPVGQSRGRQ